MFCPCLGGFSPGTPGFLTQSNNMSVKSTVNSELSVSVYACLSLYVSPAINRQLVQGVHRLCPKISLLIASLLSISQ